MIFDSFIGFCPFSNLSNFVLINLVKVSPKNPSVGGWIKDQEDKIKILAPQTLLKVLMIDADENVNSLCFVE